MLSGDLFGNEGPAQPAVLVTIICEAVLRDSVLMLLKGLKIKGHIINHVAAEDQRGMILGSSPDDMTNVEIRAIAPREVSEVIFHTLQKHRGDHAVIVYRQDIEALLP
jgi:hypothetical protein